MTQEIANDVIAEISIDDYAESKELPFKEGLTDVTLKVQNTLLHLTKERW